MAENEGEAFDSAYARAGGTRRGAPRVFVSYRRDDAADTTDRLAETLKNSFGSDCVFVDIDMIDAGAPFAEVVDRWIRFSDVLLAVIGPQWLAVQNEDGARRLHDPNDYVRLEIEAGLAKGILVIPVLVQGAPIPKKTDLPASLAPLVDRNAIELTRAHWRQDVDRLIASIKRSTGGADPTPPTPRPDSRTSARPRWLAVSLVGIAGAAVALIVSKGSNGPARGGSAGTVPAIASTAGSIASAQVTTAAKTGPAVSPPSGAATTPISPASTAPVTTSTAPIARTATSPSTSTPLAVVTNYWHDIAIHNFNAAYAAGVPGFISESEAQFVASERAAKITEAHFAGWLVTKSGSTAEVKVGSLRTRDRHFGCRDWNGRYQLTYTHSHWLIEKARLEHTQC